MATKATSGEEPPMTKDILLTVDYHDAQCMIRRKNLATDQEFVRKVDTERDTLSQWMLTAVREAKAQRGRAVWIQESTTGWARVKVLLSDRVDFRLVNVLQMPLPPKARRRKTDKVDTARMQREHLAGTLPLAHQPTPECRQLRRLAAYREDLVDRRTAVRNC
jgi:transposase